MKKFLFLTSCAALALASCSDDLGFKTESPKVEGKYQLTAEYNFGMGEETRTSLSYNNGFTYHWDDGDAIGLFNAEGNDFTNAYFRYSGNGNIFMGDVNVFTAPQVYAYYPYNSQASISPSQKLNLYINQHQNYNYDAVKGVTWNNNYPIGYFAQGAAPAVALGMVSEGALSMTFEDVASYLVFPVAGEIAENIKNFTLTIGNGTTNQVLYGTMSVDMQSLKNPFVTLDVTYPNQAQVSGSSNPNYNAAYTTITLNAGKDFTLSQTDMVNLWFVVPEGVVLDGQTITLTATYDALDAKGNVIKPNATAVATRTMPAGTAATQRNNVRWIFAVPNSDVSLRKPFYFTSASADTYVIQTQQQFLEYAYLATAGTGFAEKVYDGTLNDEIKKTEGTQYAAYCDFPNMVTDQGLKPALLANSITFSQEELVKFLGTNNTTYLTTYLNAIYGSFLTQGTINTIGGGAPYTIYGNNQTISKLKIVGNGVFSSSSAAGNCFIEDLTLSDVNVNPSVGDGVAIQALNPNSSTTALSFSFFNTNYLGYHNVTVGSGCTVTAPTVGQKQVAKTAIFNILPTQYIATSEIVTNKTSLPMASQLQVNSDFSFYENVQNTTPADYSSIVLSGQPYIITVSSAAQASQVINKVIPGNYGYSVLTNYKDSPSVVSYWTGTTYSAANSASLYTAEMLADNVQNGTGGDINLNTNIDLMGKNWWAKTAGTTNVKLNAKVTISNIYMDGTSNSLVEDDEDDWLVETGFITLLGAGVKVAPKAETNNTLTLSNVIIKNANNGAKNYLGALGAWASGSITNVSVSGLSVTASKASYNGVGGLLASVNAGDQMQGTTGKNNFKGCSVTGMSLSGTGVSQGYLAGYVTLNTTKGVYTIYNNATGTGNVFGTKSFTVDPSQGADDVRSTTVNLTGFSSSFASSFKPVLGGTLSQTNANAADFIDYTVYVQTATTGYIYKLETSKNAQGATIYVFNPAGTNNGYGSN